MAGELKTEYEFTLPMGYVDKEGNLHRKGVMRLATAKDEIVPLTDPRVARNKAYMIVVLLSRVVSRLGTLAECHTGIVENLFAADLRYLEELYNRINEDEVSVKVKCPECGAEFEKEFGSLGE
jgi:hypothetical protein